MVTRVVDDLAINFLSHTPVYNACIFQTEKKEENIDVLFQVIPLAYLI